jgi:hypothetical protein
LSRREEEFAQQALVRKVLSMQKRGNVMLSYGMPKGLANELYVRQVVRQLDPA